MGERLLLSRQGERFFLGERELAPEMRVACYLWPELGPLLCTVVQHQDGLAFETDGNVFMSLNATWGPRVRFALLPTGEEEEER